MLEWEWAGLVANGGISVRDIEDEFGGVHILFPKASDKANADKVIIRGPKEDVAKAKETLKEVAQHCEETTQEVVLETKPEFIKFLIGRGMRSRWRNRFILREPRLYRAILKKGATLRSCARSTRPCG